jgi:predicted O-methyltransferase YrrM
MHQSSEENLARCKDRYIDGLFSAERDRLSIVDIGAADVNGSYRPFFDKKYYDYTGLDLEAGPGVDVVLQNPYEYPLPDNSVDIALSGQMIEHCEFFWTAFKEMVRIVKPDGYLIIIAPSAGPIHRYPVDCYRFYPDGLRALAKWADCEVIDVWLDNRGPWNDVVGVFAKKLVPEHERQRRAAVAMEKLAHRPVPNGPVPRAADAAAEIFTGAAAYLDVLKKIHATLGPRNYLEIGVRLGNSLALARCPAIAVDPAPDLRIEARSDTRMIQSTSDEFFESFEETAPFDLTFIDGMHLFEFALRDFINSERLSSPTSLIVMDDIFPNHALQAKRVRETQIWTGDVWKIVPCLRQMRPDLLLLPVDAAPGGLLLIAGLAPENSVLRQNYNPIIARHLGSAFNKVPSDVLARKGALAPDDERIARLAKLLSELRDRNCTRPQVRRALIQAHLATGAG